jgi:hypothetical protein
MPMLQAKFGGARIRNSAVWRRKLLKQWTKKKERKL